MTGGGAGVSAAAAAAAMPLGLLSQVSGLGTEEGDEVHREGERHMKERERERERTPTDLVLLI